MENAKGLALAKRIIPTLDSSRTPAPPVGPSDQHQQARRVEQGTAAAMMERQLNISQKINK